MAELISRMPRQRAQAGQSMVFLAIAAVAILGFLGLVLDGGRLYFEKRRLQAAADAGALAAAQELRRGFDDGDYVRASAVVDTGLNGYNDNNSTISVANPPSSGPYSANNLFAEVRINRAVPTTFMRILGFNSSTVAARSVAGLLPDRFFCIYALDPEDNGAFTNQGNASYRVNCGIMVNSVDPAAFNGNGTNACTEATFIGVTGGYEIDCSGPAQTTPTTGVPAVIDPLAYLVEPDLTALPQGRSSMRNINGQLTKIYEPGYYGNPVRISAGDVVVFEPGLYALQNGLDITGGTITALDTTFFIDNSTGNRTINIGAGAMGTFKAPSSGPYKGMLFWTSRNSPYRRPHHKLSRGSAGSSYSGTFYFPNEHFDWAGTPDSAAANAAWQLIVARTVSISGDATSAMMNPPPDNENPIIGPIMVE